MNYIEAQDYLNSFINYETKLEFPYKESFKLERMQDLLESLDNPQDAVKSIHIAGTKGKGSTSAYCANILKEAGFRTGLYTSPHLNTFRERIRILDGKIQDQDPYFSGMISEKDVCIYVERLKQGIERFNKKSSWDKLSFFEVYTALAFLYFKDKKVDFVVLETGLGGRLDATNAADSLVSVITPISFEHTQKLGNTLKEIATEKAGIIKKKNQVVVSAIQPDEALSAIKKRCQEFDAKLYVMGKDIFFEELFSDINGQVFNYFDSFCEYANLRTSLLGSHQLINAATAIGIIDALRLFNFIVPPEAIKKGLEATSWPGRFEIMAKDPFVILDGAQNAASAEVLKKTIKKIFGDQKVILILGVSQDKDLQGICRELELIAKTVILTKADNPRASEPKNLIQFFPKNKEIRLTSSVKEAIELSKAISEKTDIILASGSLFVVGEARDLWLKKTKQ
ncbi:MAG: bifunctional folylpolyglutamate synthase/dihydrofolate synthase [Candidatus Omnitrophica bacterium]|nr:bifunctional folylpolyglutamate synthase/dihydrofolate synthase [Candidatus Omnitrophota bacterium]HOX54280.1 folylpolyglutamate synthase/dihydrofolate synthase family protein [Candidatus Omnitrophota bacterium]